MSYQNYLFVGRASELEKTGDRIIFRIFEMLPGLLSWGALILAFLLSWLLPVWVSIFIICFAIYWLFRTIYFSFHLYSGYKKMEENEKTDWLGKIKASKFKNFGSIYHLVVLPMYEEPLQIVRDAIGHLLKADYPKEKMIVVLACEERAQKLVRQTAAAAEKEFGGKFYKFLVTWHPSGIPGEIPGKGSNETWAAKKAKELIVDPLGLPYQNVIFSSFDVDTCVFPKYFSCLTYYYLTSGNPTRTSFQPVPLFINNIWQAPVISRIFSFSSTFWHTINQERPEKLITFSSHSMSFKALVDIGFKQTNIVSDDSRIFWQCFFRYRGDYQVKALYYPISMDANVSKNIFKTLVNMYKQQKRWAYGVCDIPYFLLGFMKNKGIPLHKKYSLGMEVIGGHFSWAVASILIFLLGWLPLFLGGSNFSQTILSYNLPKVISRLMTVSMIGLIGSAYLSFLLLPPKPPQYGRHRYLLFAVSWLFFPIMMLFFTALPALDAQTRLMFGKYMSFWPTEKVRKNF